MRQTVTERFSFKISIILIIILLFSLTLNALLNFFNFEKTYREIVSSRFYVAGKDLRSTIEYQLTLGLSLAEMKNIQALADELKKKDTTIASIAVSNDQDRVIYATDTRRIGEKLAPRLVSEARRHDRAGGSKQTDERAGTVLDGGLAHLVLPVLNSFGMRVGAITLSYPANIIAGPVSAMKVFLLVVFVVALVVFSAITFVTVQVLSRRLRERVTGMDQALRDLLAGHAAAPSAHQPYGMELDFQTFRSTAAQALSEITDLERRAEASTIPIKKRKHGRKK